MGKITLESKIENDNYTQFLYDNYDIQNREKTVTEVPIPSKGDMELMNSDEWNILLICGKSGSGKSTILKQLYGDVKPIEYDYSKCVISQFPRLTEEGVCDLLSSIGLASVPSVRAGRSWGDVELALKYEFLDMNDYEGRALNQAVFGGSAELYGAGLNFYLGKNTKIALNYQYVNNDRYANGKGKLICGLDAAGNPTNNFANVDAAAGDAGVNYHMLLARFQVAF